jgi:hypothetical protein
MVRVEVWRESAKRVILPGKVRLRVVTVTLTGSPSWMLETALTGTGSVRRRRLFWARRTTGMDWVWEAIPAWIMEPVLA